MNRRLTLTLLLCTLVGIMAVSACVTKPQPIDDRDMTVPADNDTSHTETIESGSAAQDLPVTNEDNEIVAEFGDITITKKDYDKTKSEIERVVDALNKVTASKDYTRWRTFLSREYIEYYSSPDVLKNVSDSLPIKTIKLHSLFDYFKYVFVPSRQKVRVDAIKFLTPTRVNVEMNTPSGKLLVYILEKSSGGWFLIPKEDTD